MLRPLREQLRQMMTGLDVSRTPVIRRSDEADMLLATDLPLLVNEAIMNDFLPRLAEAGWQTRMHRGWLLLDHAVAVPAIEGTPIGEAACVISLLERHPGGGNNAELIRLLAKAPEQGEKQMQRLFLDLHRRFAGMLREHRHLPEKLIPYVRYAALTERRRP